MLGLMDSGDIGFWASNTTFPAQVPTDENQLYHAPEHAQALALRASQVGIPAVVTHGLGQTPSISRVDYLLSQLGVK